MAAPLETAKARNLPTPCPFPEGEGLFVAFATRLAGLTGALLGWRPYEFWRSTPAELATILTALAPAAGAEPPDVADRQKLMEQFPDGQ